MKDTEIVTDIYADRATQPRWMAGLFRTINVIERGGNKLPHPFWLFWILAGVLGAVSLVLSLLGVSVTTPDSGETVPVRNLLSVDGIGFAAGSALDNFAEFPALPVVLVMLLGVSVAEKSGLIEALLRLTVVRLPARWVTFAIAFSGMIAHIMSDSAYLVMIPIGALAFRAVGRSPVLGVMVAYVAVSAGFNASPLVTPSDAIRTSIATAAAQTVDPTYVVTPVATYFFSAASSLFLAVTLTAVVELVLAKRPDFVQEAAETGQNVPEPAASDEAAPEHGIESSSVALTATERRSLKLSAGAFLTFVVAVVALLAVPNSPLLGEGGSLVQSTVVVNIAYFVALLLVVVGYVYGKTAGTIPDLSAVPAVMAGGVSSVSHVVVLFFAVSQFLAYFTWTGIGSVLTVNGADLLQALNAPHIVILLSIVIAISLLNMVITSGSAMWAILAPILVPMMMYIQMPPEAAMVAFMIGDSVTNAVTPMSPFFVLALGFVQQYRKSAGIGTMLSFTLPVAVVFLIAWSAFFAIWYSLGIPLGPGVTIQ